MEIKITDKLSQQVLSIDGKTSLASTEVIIGEEQPDEGKLWIDTGEISNLGTEVVDNVNGKQTNKAPSVRAVVQDLVSILYPVGSIYMSTNSTNPKDLFGIGEWEQIKDTFLMSAGTTYGAGTTGGTASHTHSIGHTHGVPGVAHTHTSAAHTHTVNGHTHSTGNHTLTVAEMPSHTHWTREIAPGLYAGWGNKSQDGWITQSLNASNGGTWETAATGGGGAHNHGNTGSTSLTTNSTTPGATGSTTPKATTTNSQSTSTSGSGGSTTLDITPACEAAYCWKRTA